MLARKAFGWTALLLALCMCCVSVEPKGAPGNQAAFGAAAAAAAATTSAATEVVQRLKDLRQNYETGVIPVRRASSLERTVFGSKERPFGVLLFVTATEQESNCGLCAYMRHNLELVARLVKRSNARYEARGQLPVFTLMVDLTSKNQNEFVPWLQKLKIPLLPSVLYIPANADIAPDAEYARFRPGPPPAGDGMDRKAFAEWVMRQVNADMQRLGRQPPLRLRVGGPVYVVPTLRRHWLLVLSLFVAGLYLGWRWRWYQRTGTWLAFVLLLYAFALGGGHGWIIQGTPLFVWDGERIRVRSTNPYARRRGPVPPDALAAEGFIHAARYILTAALMLALDRLPRKTRRSWQYLLCVSVLYGLLAYSCYDLLRTPLL
jgi:hypothetical protein